MRYITSLLTTVVFLFSMVAFAQTESVTGSPNEIFRPLSKRMVEKVVKQGITKVGDLDLPYLLEMLDTVEWRTFDIGFLGGSGGGRHTSIYMVESRMVVVNMLSLQNLVGTEVRIDRWALHEALGALGYPDENYDITTSLTFIADAPQSKAATRADLVERSLSNIKLTTTNRVYESSSGGSTVIGGGGDAPIVELKCRLLDRFEAWALVHHPNLSAKKITKALERLTKFAINFDPKSRDYNSADFKLERNQLLIAIGGNSNPSLMYGEAYLDAVLETISPILLK